MEAKLAVHWGESESRAVLPAQLSPGGSFCPPFLEFDFAGFFLDVDDFYRSVFFLDFCELDELRVFEEL